MKKSAAFTKALLASTLALTIALAGCAAPASTSASAGGTSFATSAKPAELVWYTLGEQPDDLPKVLEQLNPILIEKINATVDIRFISNAEYDEKMTSIVNSGEQFDICFTCDWANSYAVNAGKGAFVDLTPYISGENAALKSAVDARFWEGASIDGKVYAVPANKELPYAPVWAFTKDLVEKYEFDLSKVTDLASLEPLLKTIKENEPEIVPLPLRASDIPSIIDEYDIPATRDMPAYVRYDDASCTVVNPFTQADVIEKLTTINDYFKKGYINQDAATNKQKLKNRLIYCGWYSPGAEQIWGNQAGYEIVCAPRYDNYYATTSCLGSMQAVSANSQNPQAAVDFLELLNTDAQVKNLVTFGIEGVHYEKTADNSIQYLEDAALYTTDIYTIGNQFINYTVDPQSKDLWAQFEIFNNAATPSVLFGFSYSNAKVKSEYAAVMNITAQYLPQLFTGSSGDVTATLAELNTKLEQAGLQKIIDDMQAQINEWKPKK